MGPPVIGGLWIHLTYVPRAFSVHMANVRSYRSVYTGPVHNYRLQTHPELSDSVVPG